MYIGETLDIKFDFKIKRDHGKLIYALESVDNRNLPLVISKKIHKIEPLQKRVNKIGSELTFTDIPIRHGKSRVWE